MSKKCAPVWCEADFQGKSVKTDGVRHFLTVRCRFAWQVPGILHLVTSEQNVRVLCQFQLQPPLHCITRRDTTRQFMTTATTATQLQQHVTTLTTSTATTIQLCYFTLHSTSLHYTTLHYSTLDHYTSIIQLQLHYTNYTTPQLQLHYATTTAALPNTTSSSFGCGDHCNHCNRSKKQNPNHLSVHQWIRSAIFESQQPTSPIGSYF